MVTFISYLKQLFIISFLTVMFTACTQDNPARHLNLGNWYLQRGLIDEAIMEYREVSRLYSGNQSVLDRAEFQVLGTAHLKLAIAYTKKGWWEYALAQAKRSFEITPNKDCHDLITLIQDKLLQDSNSHTE